MALGDDLGDGEATGALSLHAAMSTRGTATQTNLRIFMATPIGYAR